VARRRRDFVRIKGYMVRASKKTPQYLIAALLLS
jgi:hypothetical protein